MEYPGFCGAAYLLQNISADCQRCVNLYPQPDESGVGKNRAYLLSTPGLNKVSDLTATSGAENGIRGTYTASNDRLFAVSGGFLFELDSTYAIIGSPYPLPEETGTTPVSMTDNGQDMMIATGPNAYWFNFAANTLTQVTDAVFFGATTCGFIDGYIVFNQPNTQIFWITNLYSTVINPLGFASAEGNPDNLISLLVDHREIWLFGDVSTEVWYDSGNANFPFSFIQGAYISHGIAAAASAVRLDNTTLWLSNDEFGQGIAYRANGYAPSRISTFAVEQAWQRYPTIADAVGWTYQQDGHSFYVLNFPSGDATWVYDAATGLWHERAYLGTLAFNDGQLHRGRPNTHSFAFGKHIVGDWETGFLYQMSPQFPNDDGREIQRLRSAPFIDKELKRIIYSQFQLDMEVGVQASVSPAIYPEDQTLRTFTGTQGGMLAPSAPGDTFVFGPSYLQVEDHEVDVPQSQFAGIYPTPIAMIGNASPGDDFNDFTVAQPDHELFLSFFDSSFALISTIDLSTQGPFTHVIAPADTATFMVAAPNATFGQVYAINFKINGDISGVYSFAINPNATNYATSFGTDTDPDVVLLFPVGLINPNDILTVTFLGSYSIIFYDASRTVISSQAATLGPFVAPADTVYWSVQIEIPPAWQPNHAYMIGDLITDPSGHIQKVTTAGTSGSTIPMFDDGGGTTPDGPDTLVWTDQGVNYAIIYTITSVTVTPGFFITFFDSSMEVLSTTDLSTAGTVTAPSSTAFFLISVNGPAIGTDYELSFSVNGISPFTYSLTSPDGTFETAFTTPTDPDAASAFPLGVIEPGDILTVDTLVDPTTSFVLVFYNSSYGIISTTPAAIGAVTAPADAAFWSFQLVTPTLSDTYHIAYTLTVPAGMPTEALINLRWSDDGGYSWSNYYAISMGNIGQYRKRIIWRRLGNGRQRVFEVSTGQLGVGLSLYNAYLELTGTNS